ncbi:MAG: murein biosynthesis integral membrane protein MurJ, partial [Opitutales bacterium]
LSMAVLLGGVIQVGVSAWALWRDGWRPAIAPETSPAIREVWLLFLPGLAGAAILQVNILVSRLFAFGLNDAAVSILYLASRLMELPLGVFTVAIVTVTFPLLARQGGAGRYTAFRDNYAEALRLILAIMIPAGLGLTWLARPILDVLFVWGAFESTDASSTVPILAVYALSLPAYSLATLATRGFHALKDMQTPVQAALISLVLNAVLCLALILPFGILGLALANVVAAATQAWILHRSLMGRLRDIGGVDPGLGLGPDLARIAVASLALSVICLWAVDWLPHLLPDWESKAVSLVLVGLTVPLAALVYFGVLGLLCFSGTQELIALLLRRRGANRPDSGGEDSRIDS